METEFTREAGILLPITSLPSPYGIGCFSTEAYLFIDFLVEAGQRHWQILPLGQTGYGNSPYQSFSAFGGNPYLISLTRLCEEGLLTRNECDGADLGTDRGPVDYGAQYHRRFPLLRLAYKRGRGRRDEKGDAFECKNAWWLENYALFMAIKNHLKGIPLSEWKDELRHYGSSEVEGLREELSEEIDFQKYLQRLFYRQWISLREYANSRGIRIIGDIPIYLSADSAEVWTHPHLFQLDETGRPTCVAGCPPDDFAPDGQLWGNPLYRWDAHAQEGFHFWIERLRYAFELYDTVRIDHFRGFDSYYAIPYGEATAQNGHWEQGPGMALFSAVAHALGQRSVIAEDLGYMTDSVRALVKDSGFSGMKILQFAFDPSDTRFCGEYLPHRYPIRSVAYTGTHDNPTLSSWLESLGADQQQMINTYLWDENSDPHHRREALIALLMRSPAHLCIVPMQDYLGLGEEGRLNRPATVQGNWQWRMSPNALSADLATTIRQLCTLGGRAR